MRQTEQAVHMTGSAQQMSMKGIMAETTKHTTQTGLSKLQSRACISFIAVGVRSIVESSIGKAALLLPARQVQPTLSYPLTNASLI